MVKKLNEVEVTEIDDDMKAVIDLSVNGVYIVRDGKKELVDPPKTGYGTQLIFWREGKPTHSEIGYTQKFG